MNNTATPYLNRTLIKTTFDYDDEHIKVESATTTFINLHKIDRLKLSELLTLYNDINSLTEELNVKKVYKYHYKTQLLEHWNEYTEIFNSYETHYDLILQLLPRLEERGIHIGFTDDDYLETIMDSVYSLMQCYYNNFIITTINNIHSYLLETKKELMMMKKGSTYYNLTKISL